MDDGFDDEGTDLFISFGLEVTVMRFIGNTLVPSRLTMNAAIDKGADADDNDIELALTKWRYWIDNVVAKSIVFANSNTQAMDILLDDAGMNKTGNLFVLTPDEPSDEVLGSVFQAKFNALGQGKLLVLSLEITSDNLHGLAFTLIGDHSEFLPNTVEEFLGQKSFWEKPWWHRNDASSIDVIKPEGDDVKTPAWAYSLDFLDRTKNQRTTVISSRPGFQPTVIDGGKPDEPK